jgi:hypothetical protein
MEKLKLALATMGSVLVVVGVFFGATAWASAGHGSAPAAGPPGRIMPHVTSERPPQQAETTFVPITPCRIVSTVTVGGKIGNGVTRSYYVGGTTHFTAQGGKSGGCGIPIGADAIAANLTAAQSDAHGFIRVWPHNGTEPTATVLSYPATQGSTGSGITVKIQNDAALALKLKNYGGPTNVIIDVTGYYAEQMEAMISPAAKIYSGANRVVSAELLSTGEYQVDFDHDVSNCSPMIDTYNVYVYGSAYAFNGTHVTVFTWRLDSTTHLETAENDYFYISMAC